MYCCSHMYGICCLVLVLVVWLFVSFLVWQLITFIVYFLSDECLCFVRMPLPRSTMVGLWLCGFVVLLTFFALLFLPFGTIYSLWL